MATFGLFEIFLSIASFFVLFFFLKTDDLLKNWPIVGMLPDLFVNVNRIHEWSVEIMEKSQCTFVFKGPWFSHMNMLITSDPANIHYIMSSNFTNFPKGTEFKEMFDILGDGIFNSDLELWKNQRRVAQGLMSDKKFYLFLLKTTHDKVEKGLVPVLEHVSKNGLVLDLQDLFQRFTFDATCVLLTGHDPGCLSIDFPQVDFAKAMDTAEEAIFYRHVFPEIIWKLQRRLGIGEEKKLKKAWETLDRVVAEIVTAKKEAFMIGKRNTSDEEEEGIDLLTSFMKGDDRSQAEDKSLRDTIVNFLLAGRDTTSSALSWFFWVLSKNPQAETKIRQELCSKLSDKEAQKWRLFNTQELRNLVYLHGAVCETLRLHPPVPFQHKAPIKLDTLPTGHQVDPKMKILFSLYAMGRMESIWGEDCLEFKPERWITQKGGIKHEPSYKFLAFNAGPRTCIGKEVALTQMKAVVAAIVHNYNVQVLDGQAVEPCLSIILHMKHGMKVKLTNRWASSY